MAQTYADLQTQALWFDDFDADKYRAAAKQAILDAIGEVARQVRLPANETSQSRSPSSPGPASYSVPAGVRLTRSSTPVSTATRSRGQRGMARRRSPTAPAGPSCSRSTART
jgi:hypothetical protein